MSDILATVTPSPIRRLFGVAVMGALGALLIYMALATAPSFGWRIVLLAFGGLSVMGTMRLWQATLDRVELTATELRASNGVLLAEVDQIVSIDRGMFAFKPSNGFVLKLATRHPRGWAPGLWWRTSRRLGIGGVTSAGEAKFMAEMLAARIAVRDREV
jgi:hypothetical protein